MCQILISNMIPIYYLIVLIVICQIFEWHEVFGEPVVKVEQGFLAGQVLSSKSGREFNSFMGIPYAKPPVGPLRFQAPQPSEPWTGIRNATQVHAMCPQRDIYRRNVEIEGDENCLFLNVYAPQLNTVDPTLLPVMIFIHGGGWLCGSGNAHYYAPEILMDRDIVLVIPNYRLGALGFLSTVDDQCPGNNGLKDMALALKWTSKNIQQFGGDPRKITIFGESAGGASAHYFLTSPLTRDLISGSISQSGAALDSWAMSSAKEAKSRAKRLANQFQCPTSPSKDMVECLRKVDAYEIVAKDRVFMEWDTDPMIPFKPVVEPKSVKDAFLVEHPSETMRQGKHAQIPWMLGLTTEEGALRAAAIVANPYLLQEFNDSFGEIVPGSLQLSEELMSHSADVSKKLRKFYFGDQPINETSKMAIINLYTDGWFLHGIDESARVFLKYSKMPLYYYVYGHRAGASFSSIFGDPIGDYGVCHADELQCLFPLSDTLFKNFPVLKEDLKMRDTFTELWTNYATYGNPTPKSKLWQPMRSEQMECLNIGTHKLEMHKCLFNGRVEFWRSLASQYHTKVLKEEL